MPALRSLGSIAFVSLVASVLALTACAKGGDEQQNPSTGGKGGSGGGTGGVPSSGGWPGSGGTGTGGGSAGTGATGSGGAAGSASGGAAGAAGSGPCVGLLGQHCGSAIGLDASKLYACNDDKPTEIDTCTGSCIVRNDGNDTCPCPKGNGSFCGGDGISGDKDKLYKCQDGIVTLDQACGGTCVVGSPDKCNACPSGNGAYCGGDGIQGDTSTLYQCSNGVLSVIQVCPVSCQVKPPGVADTCGSCPSGNGAYCGSEVNADPNTLYNCTDGALTVVQKCGSTCHVSPPGVADYCQGSTSGGTGSLSCANLQWWNSSVNYQYQLHNGAYYWWDTDLNVKSMTPIQLRHDSQLVADPIEAWGWQPQFIDQVTGERFQFLHMQPSPQYMYTTAVGTTYKAGTVVGLSGGDTAATGYPKYSTGQHLCVETIADFSKAFPKGQDACQ